MNFIALDTIKAQLLNEAEPRTELVTEIQTDDGILVGYVNPAFSEAILTALSALQFYAAQPNWKERQTGIGPQPSDAECDAGSIARFALKAFDTAAQVER